MTWGSLFVAFFEIFRLGLKVYLSLRESGKLESAKDLREATGLLLEAKDEQARIDAAKRISAVLRGM